MKILEGYVSIDKLDYFLNRIKQIEKDHDSIIQGFDPCYIISRDHLREATRKAKRSFKRDEEIANSLSMEIMLYVAGTRQIEVALNTGLKENKNEAVFVIEGNKKAEEEMKKIVEEAKINYGSLVKNFFDITEKELNAAGKQKLDLLVIERVALLDIDK